MMSFKIKSIAILGVLLLMNTQSSAQELMSLSKAIQIGLENNFAIKIAEKSILIAEKNNTWAAAGRTPTISLNANFNNNLINDNNPASFLQGTYYTGSLLGSSDASMVLFSGGRFRIAKDQLNHIVIQEQVNKEAEIELLLRNIFQQYNEVIFQKERLNVLSESYALSKSKLEYENTKKEYGQSNTLNIIQFENALVEDSINIINQKLQIERTKNTFFSTLKIPIDADYIFEDILEVTDEKLDINKLRGALLSDNYTLKNLQVASDLNRLNTLLAQAQTKPTIAINGSVGVSQNGFKFFEDDPNTGDPFPFLFSNRINGSVGANLTWDIYDGGLKNTAIQNAQIEEKIALLRIEEAEADLKNQLDLLLRNYNIQRDLLKMSDEQIFLSNKNLELLDERFKSGLINSLDYRTVQLQYLNAAFNKINAIYNLIITKSEIDFLVGRFSEQ